MTPKHTTDAKHTPGPWTFSAPVEGTPDMTVLTYIGPHKVPMYLARVYGTGQHTGLVNQERLANARLIAAAPELLEALKECPTDINAMAYRSHAYAIKRLEYITEIALKAIAKAEGRE